MAVDAAMSRMVLARCLTIAVVRSDGAELRQKE